MFLHHLWCLHLFYSYHYCEPQQYFCWCFVFFLWSPWYNNSNLCFLPEIVRCQKYTFITVLWRVCNWNIHGEALCLFGSGQKKAHMLNRIYCVEATVGICTSICSLSQIPKQRQNICWNKSIFAFGLAPKKIRRETIAHCLVYFSHFSNYIWWKPRSLLLSKKLLLLVSNALEGKQ